MISKFNMDKYILKKEKENVLQMSIDRGNEVDDEIASGLRSVVYDIAENRVHVQKTKPLWL